MSGVHFEVHSGPHGQLAVATLANPKALNALTQDMVEVLLQQLTRWAADPAIHCVVLRGDERAFCAGGDVVAVAKHALAHPGDPNPVAEAFFTAEYQLDYAIHTYPKPLVAWGHGIVMGGGVGMLVGASHRVVTETARVAMPEITIGLYPDVGGSWFLHQWPGRTGLFLGLTGAHLNAADACYVGLGDYFIGDGQRQAVLDALVALPWSGEAGGDGDRVSHCLGEFAAACEGERPDSPVARHRDRLERLSDCTRVETFAARLLAADFDDPWLTRARETFRRGSPTSAKLIFAAYTFGRHQSLVEAFQQEWILSVQCASRSEFAEGVRALLIDKDKTPRWQPATLAEVRDDVIAAHFTLPPHLENHPLAALGDD